MKYNILRIGIFLFVAHISYSQDAYSDIQLQAFTEIYMEAKNTKTVEGSQTIISNLLSEYNIDIERYRTIFKANLEGQNVELTDNEISFFDKIQNIDRIEKEKHTTTIKNLCTSSGLEHQIYTDIKDRYKSDIKFQRTLKPYFDHYINSIK